ncbi:MAG TPA: DUF1028 domain-containing protein [Ignavibacteriaceae bacterium]|nr:DUF1028 domain-containing protein [Ignavibacteriaceae bacterium]
MKKFYLLFIFLSALFFSTNVIAQDTFSICAVDTVTGEIGSAGASCVGPYNGVGAFIISDVIEGIGVIHTQAYWLSANQQNAHNKMLEGLSPQEIIDWLTANDVENNPTKRQYGIVDLVRHGESAGYTGVNCDDYKNHLTGPGYSIQGNILLGSFILDSMKTTFLNTQGALADKLMAALQAAKVVGADTRCAVRGTSSQSGFVKVVRIGDGSSPYLQIIVPDTPVGTDPIDLVQGKFDDWKDSLFTFVDPFLSQIASDPDTIPSDGISQALITITPRNNSDTLLAGGLQVVLSNTGAGSIGTVTDLGDGTYQAEITSPVTAGTDTISAVIISAGDTVSVHTKAVIIYISPTSIKDDYPSAGSYFLFQNYPEPFNPSTTIKYRVSEVSFVTLKVYDVIGNEIATLVNQEKPKGSYKVDFNAASLPSGVYFYQLKAGSYLNTRKMVLLK